MGSIRLSIIGIALSSCLLISACAEKIVPVTPKFSGRLIVLSGNDLLEVTAGPNSTFSRSTVVSGITEAIASPDQTQLLYATKDSIVLRKLATGDVEEMIKGDSYCLAWSPDGKRFSYKQRTESSIKLFVSDLEDNAKLIWEERFPDKQTVNQASSQRANDVSGCAHWVAPDRLIFDRFGPSQNKGGDVKPNTTTLATVADSAKLVDAEKKWSVEGICKTGSAILRSQDGQILIAKSLENPKAANPSSGPCSACRFAGFASNSCVPFFIEDSSSTSTDVFYLNPTSWQRQRSGHIGQPFSVNARTLINSGARLMVVGDAPSSLLLVDTETGEMTNFFPKSGGPPGSGELTAPAPIVWIERN
ncbi:MAG: hypothetical protein ACXW18_02295 [Pyrinomonadaceae bacterium]